jgi:hypothetical protein
MHADEEPHERFEVKRTDRQEACSLDGACANWTEGLFRRQRRAEIGIHAHLAGAYRLRHTQESSGREDHGHVARPGLLASRRADVHHQSQGGSYF